VLGRSKIGNTLQLLRKTLPPMDPVLQKRARAILKRWASMFKPACSVGNVTTPTLTTAKLPHASSEAAEVRAFIKQCERGGAGVVDVLFDLCAEDAAAGNGGGRTFDNIASVAPAPTDVEMTGLHSVGDNVNVTWFGKTKSAVVLRKIISVKYEVKFQSGEILSMPDHALLPRPEAEVVKKVRMKEEPEMTPVLATYGVGVMGAAHAKEEDREEMTPEEENAEGENEEQGENEEEENYEEEEMHPQEEMAPEEEDMIPFAGEPRESDVEEYHDEGEGQESKGGAKHFQYATPPTLSNAGRDKQAAQSPLDSGYGFDSSSSSSSHHNRSRSRLHSSRHHHRSSRPHSASSRGQTRSRSPSPRYYHSQSRSQSQSRTSPYSPARSQSRSYSRSPSRSQSPPSRYRHQGRSPPTYNHQRPGTFMSSGSSGSPADGGMHMQKSVDSAKKVLKKCSREGCISNAKTGGLCLKHTVKIICTASGCTNYARNSTRARGLCSKHGGGGTCSVPGCSSNIHARGLCGKHGGKGNCTVSGCTSNPRSKGLCSKHGGAGICSESGCSNAIKARGLCGKHDLYGTPTTSDFQTPNMVTPNMMTPARPTPSPMPLF